MHPEPDVPVQSPEGHVGPSRVRVSGNGQVSIPAAVRRRWRAKEVIVIDKGDRLIVRPVLAMDELVGKYQDRPGPTSDELRARERAEDARREGQRLT